MNPIVFFHRDMFRSERLIPGESKSILVPLSETIPLRLIGRRGPHIPPTLGEHAHEYDNVAGLLTQLIRIRKSGSPLIVIESPLTADSVLCAILCTILDYQIVFQPFSQFTKHVMKGRLFSANPDVRELEKNTGKQGIRGHGRSVFMKKLTLVLMRACFSLKGVGWIVLSKFEESEIRKLVPSTRAVPFLRVPWALAGNPLKVTEPDFFRRFPAAAGKVKLVLWARLDYELKGIDRLLNGVATGSGAGSDRYHLFLIGPDYAGGQAKALARIEELGIADRVTIVTPEQYTSGDHSPLATADASVLLSRWDGFPRALRESLQLDVPVLVSPETHFSEIIDECRCGEHVAEPDNPESVAAAIHRLVDGILSGNYQKASFDRARAILSAEYLASTMAEGFTQIARQFVHRADEN